MTDQKCAEFKRKLDELRGIITDGIAYFSCWQGLRVGDEESAHALNRYRGLFLPARTALLWMALLQFAKVFDRDPRTVSLINLLNAAQADRECLTPYATLEDLAQIERELQSNEALLKRLKRLRDQRIAHHDAIASGDRSVLYGEVRQLVEGIKSVYNSLCRGHDRSYTSFERLADDANRHTADVVRIMREEMERDME